MKYTKRTLDNVLEELIEKFGDEGFDLEAGELEEVRDSNDRKNGDLAYPLTVRVKVPFPGLAVTVRGRLYLWRGRNKLGLRLGVDARSEERSLGGFASNQPFLWRDHIDSAWDGEFVWK